MIRLLLLNLFCLVFISLSAQTKIADLPFKDGKVVYHFEQSISRQKPKKTFEKIMDWLKKDPTYSILESDVKQGTIRVKSRRWVRSKTQQNALDYLFDLKIEKEKVTFDIHQFYFTDIELTLEGFLKKHEGTDRETVQNNIWLVTTDIHNQTIEFSNIFKAFLKEM